MTEDRRRYQQEVDRLLQAVAEGVAEVRALSARGIRGQGLADRKRELANMRRPLATLVMQTTNRRGLTA
jgi:hypothetical protein